MTERAAVRADVVSRVQVVLVAWNSAREIGDAIESIPDGVPVVVVDNGSADDSAEIAERSGADVVALSENAGFGPACNLGARRGRGDAVLFLNPDAALLGGEACLEALLAELDADPRVGAVAPALEGLGQDVFQLRRLPTTGSLAREAFLINRLWPANRGLARERYLDVPRAAPFDVEQPAAAALLVRRSAFEAVGGFDAAFAPAWFEDVDLCARLLAAGWRIRYSPYARARHVGGVAMRSLAYRDFLPLYTRNLMRYAARHQGAGARAAQRAVLLSGALLRLLLLPFVRGDHARGDAARAYGRVVRGLLGLGWKTSLAATARR